MRNTIFKTILIVVTVCPSYLYGQLRRNVYQFVEYQLPDDSSGNTISGGYRFSYVKGLTNDEFWVRNGVWFVKINSKWMSFFNRGKKVDASIKINGYAFKLHWKKTSKLDGTKVLYKLELKPVGATVSGMPTYYFSPESGIVGIDGHDALLIREDKRYLRF